jgi:hypothetical protein
MDQSQGNAGKMTDAVLSDAEEGKTGKMNDVIPSEVEGRPRPALSEEQIPAYLICICRNKK